MQANGDGVFRIAPYTHLVNTIGFVDKGIMYLLILLKTANTIQ